jgi:hypothetical protein
VGKRKKEPADFFAFIPHQIEADWDEKYGPLLQEFPLNILFAGIKTEGGTEKQSLVDVCYVPALETFREDSQRKQVCYFTKPKNGFFIRVIFEKDKGRWQTKKFKGDKLVRSAFGSTFDTAMLHTTMGGRKRMSAESRRRFLIVSDRITS